MKLARLLDFHFIFFYVEVNKLITNKTQSMFLLAVLSDFISYTLNKIR